MGQQIISCDKTDGGCNGGDLPTAWDYVKSAGGIVKESTYPDTSGSSGSTGSCKSSKLANKVASVSGYTWAVPECTGGSCSNQDEDGMKAVLASKGPISVCVNAGSWGLLWWRFGWDVLWQVQFTRSLCAVGRL